MRNFLALFISFLFLLLPFPDLANADNGDSDPFAKFKNPVKAARNLADGANQWGALAKSLAADPLFAQLGLDKLKYDKGNQLTYDYDLQLGDVELDLKGTLSFNVTPAAGEPVASLLSRTQTRTGSGDLIDIGALHSTSANMEVFVYKEGGAYRIYARVVPNFTNYNRDPHPSLILDVTSAGLDFELLGADLTLKDLVPFAAPLPFYKQFAFNSLSRAGTSYTIKGTVNGRASTATVDNAKKTLLVTGKDLTLADFFPETAALPQLNAFAFKSFSLNDGGIAAAGAVNGKGVTVARGADKTTFTITGAGLKLADFIPAAAKVPLLAGFAFKSLVWTPAAMTVTGTVNGKDASVTADSAGQTLTITGDSLNLKDFVPETANTPALNTFAFMHLIEYPTGFSVLGHISGTEVTVTKDNAAKTYTVTSLGLKLSDFVPAAAKVQFLDAFEFVSAGRSPTSTQVSGRIKGKNIMVASDNNAAGAFTVTGDGLKIKDFLPEAASQPSLNSFALDSYSYAAGNVTVSGKANGKALLVKRSAGGAALLISGNDLKLSDFIPETSQLTYLDTFALDTVKCSPAEFIVTGKVNAKAVTVDDHITSNIFTVTGEGLVLADFIPDAKNLPYLNNFAFDSLTHTADGIVVAGRVNGKGVSVSHDLVGKTFTVKGDNLMLADFVPAAAKLDYLSRFTFLDLVYAETTLEVAGTVNGKNITVIQDNALKTFTVKGSALQLTDFVPQAARVPYLQKFDLNSVVQRPNGALVEGDVDGKALTVDADMTANTFKVTGADLLLKDFVPQAAGWSYLDNFKFDSLLSTLTGIEVSGKVNNKAITVKKTLDSPNFSVTGADIQLVDFIPQSAEVPCVNAFALDSVLRSDAELAIAGKVNGKPVAVSSSFLDKSVKMTGLGLSLPTCVPFSLNLPALKWFTFGSLFHWPDRIEVNGTIDGKAVKLVWVFSPKVITVTGDSLKLADLIPAAAKVSFLNSFTFLDLRYTEAELTVNGKAGGKNVSVIQDNAAKTFTLSGDGLKLGDLIPETAKVPYLQTFALKRVQERPDGVQVAGEVNGKAVTVETNRAAAFYKITGETLLLADFIPEVSGVSYLNNFAFRALTVQGAKWTAEGTVNAKGVTVNKDTAVQGFSATGEDIKIADLIPQAAAVPYLGTFAFDGLTYNPAVTTVLGKVNGKAVSAVKDNTDGSFTLTGAGIVLADLVPAAAKVPFLGAFAFDRLKHSDGHLEVAGRINAIAVTVAKDEAEESFSVTGSGLTLASFVPEAAKVPFLNKFSFNSFTYNPQTVTVAGKIGEKGVSVVSNSADKTFKVTGEDLHLADFVPEAGSVPFLKAFAFDILTYTQAAVVVDGKLNAKKVSVTRAFGPAAAFTATGEGLTLKDIVPEAGGLKAFDALALNQVSVTAAAVQVDGALNGKAVKFVRTRSDKPVATVTADGMVLSDIYAPLAALPGINAVAVDKISLDGANVEAEARLNGAKVDVIAHANQNDGGYVSVFFNTLSAATFIPAAQDHLASALSLEKALFIIQPAGSPARAVTAADLPGDLPKLVNWPAGTSLTLSEGVNMAGSISLASSGGLAQAFATIGVPASGSVFVKGTLAPGTFKGMTGQAQVPAAALAEADKQAILAGLDLSVELPLPALPAIAGLVTVKGPVILNIGGNARNKSSLWARVPAGIAASKPKGDLDMSVQFQVDIVGAGIGEKLDALVSLDKGSRGGLSLLALYEGVWKQPFGVQGLTLADGGFEFALDGKGADAKSSLAFFATAQIGGKNVAVTAALKRADGKLSLDYFQLDGQFRLADFPGGKNIPSGDKFELDELKLSVSGLEAKTVLAGNKVNAYMFNAGTQAAPNWIFAVNQKNFKITELLPAAKAIKPLAAMTIPQAALILSEKGLKGADRNSLGVIAKDMFDGILGKSNAPVTLPDGIALLAAFDANSMGVLGKGLNGIGVRDDAVIMGAVTGVFQGAPGVMLALNMESAGAARGLPGKVMSFKPGVPPAYFIQWAGQEVSAGLSTAMLVKAGKETLDFTAIIELQFGEAGAGVKLLGEKNGPWARPFGIKGLTLNNVKLDVAITPVGEVQFGLAGDQQYGNCHDLKSKDCVDVDLAMSVKIPLEDGLPDGVAFAGKVNPLGIPALMEITETLMGAQPGSIAKLPVPFFQINNAQLAFATPGASDPQLGLVSEGFAFAGNFFFMNQDLGRVTGAGGPGGLKIKGKIADIDLEILKFKDTSIDISINQDPKYVINATVDLLGAPQKVAIDIKPPHFSFDMTEKLGAFGSALLTITMDGFDLKKGTFDKNAGISVVGEFKSTLAPWMKDEVKKGVEELRDSAKAKFTEDTKALNEAMKKVSDLDDKIKKIKAEDQKAKDRADDVLNSAKRRVDDLADKHDHEDHEAHHCGSRWTHWACSPGWRVAAAGTWVVYEVAEKTLDAAKKTVAAATNLDPRVAALLAERDIELAGLSVAKAVVKVAEEAEDFVMKQLETVLEKAISDMPLEVDKTFIVGDLKDMVTHNDPLVLDMEFTLVGAPMHEFFAVKVPDREANLQFDEVSFALLPALAMDKLTEDALSKLSPAAARWVHSHIASQIADAEDKVRQSVEAQEEKYKAVMATFDNGTAKYKKAFAEQGDEHLELVMNMNVTDLMPDSLEYANTYLAIGHSSQCLAVSKDGMSVMQLACKDADVEQWSTVKLKDDAEGYVELKNKGLCLKARKGDERDGFEPLILSQCDQNDLHEQWKIISSDGFYDEIVNRSSQKCLHFNTEDANPESAYAVWTSCLGTDSQTFRDISDAEKPTWHKIESMVKAANGLCLDVVEEKENWLKLTPFKKEIKLYAHKCGDGSERFNYIEEVDGDIRLVHTETGACVYPQEKATTLALRACDRGDDMFWRINSKSAATDQFYMVPRNACLTLPAPAKGSTQDAEAGITNCNIVPNDSTLLEFTK